MTDSVTTEDDIFRIGMRISDEMATVDDIVRPSATPAVFELRDPDKDIYGRVV